MCCVFTAGWAHIKHKNIRWEEQGIGFIFTLFLPHLFHYVLIKWVSCIVEKLKKQDGCSLKHLSVASPNPPGLSIAQRNSKLNTDLLSLLINIWSIVEIIQNLHVSHSANPDELCSRSDDTALTSLTQKYFSSFILDGQKPSHCWPRWSPKRNAQDFMID